MHLLPDPGFGRGSIATDARLLRFGSAEAGETSLGSSRSTCSWVRPSPEDWRFRRFRSRSPDGGNSGRVRSALVCGLHAADPDGQG